MEETIEELVEVMKERIENQDAEYPHPSMSLLPQEGENIMLQLDPRWLGDPESRERLIEKVMLPAIEGSGAKLLATAIPETHDTEEVITLTVMNSFRTESLSAPIYLEAGSPAGIGEWQPTDEKHLDKAARESMQEALRDSSGKTNPDFIKLLEEQASRQD